MDCSNCKATNPDGNKFCGNCGFPSDPAFARVKEAVEAGLANKIDEALKARFRDQKGIELETSAQIASRLTEWAKTFGLIVGIPLGILAAVLAVLGVATLADFRSKVRESEAAIEKTEQSLKDKAADVAKRADALQSTEEKL